MGRQFLIWCAICTMLPLHARAERPCDEIVQAVTNVYSAPLYCMRLQCPDLSILDAGTSDSEHCIAGCNVAWSGPLPAGSADDTKRCKHLMPKSGDVSPDYYQLALCLAGSELDLNRCESRFVSRDERDFFKVARCMRASEAVALLVEPLHACTQRGECLKGSRNWQHGPCFEQCNQDAEQLIEASTTTLERCEGIKQSKPGLCALLQKVINACFLPTHCDRLSEILRTSCGGGS